MLVMLLGCSGAPIPEEVVNDVAKTLSNLGHPQAEFRDAKIVNWSRGKGEADRHDRYVDVEVHYVRGIRPEPNTMTVRIYHESVEPCRMSLDVLADDGPEPILLDNAIASAAVGAQLCDALSDMEP